MYIHTHANKICRIRFKEELPHINTCKHGSSAVPLYVTLGLVKHKTRWRSISSDDTNLEHTGHLKPADRKRETMFCFSPSHDHMFLLSSSSSTFYIKGSDLRRMKMILLLWDEPKKGSVALVTAARSCDALLGFIQTWHTPKIKVSKIDLWPRRRINGRPHWTYVIVDGLAPVVPLPVVLISDGRMQEGEEF